MNGRVHKTLPERNVYQTPIPRRATESEISNAELITTVPVFTTWPSVDAEQQTGYSQVWVMERSKAELTIETNR